MKKAYLFLAVMFLSISVFAQEKKEDQYKVNGDVIDAVLYHDNGTIAQTGSYTHDGKLQGEWVSYDKDGVKLASATYANGEKVGVWYFYQGNNIKEVTYSNSQIAEVKTWEMKDVRVVTNKP